MLRFARLAACAAIIISLSVILYGGYTILLTRQLTQKMHVRNDIAINFSRVKPYLDGVVIDRVKLGPHMTLSTLYLKGYPWQILNGNIQHIFIKQADIQGMEIADQMMVWPFPRHIPLTIENMDVSFLFLGKELHMSGNIKQAPNIPLLFKLGMNSADITFHAQGEIRVQDKIVQSIDLEFHDAALDFSALETKRSSGWLSLMAEEDMWNIIGEMESGFVKIPQKEFFDMTLKLNGVAQEIDFVISGNEQKTGNAWVIERDKEQIHIQHLDQKKTLSWQGLSNRFLHQTGSLTTVFAPEKIEQPKEEQPKKEIKTADKEKSEKVETISAEVEKKPVDQDQEQEQATLPTAIVYAPIEQLLKESVFKGFLYDRPLVLLSRICMNEAENECWIARGQGGVLRYDTTDPWAVPSYFSRLRNYQEASQLRTFLAELPIELLVISGDQKGARDMVIYGKDNQGRNIHIELSITGLSLD